MNEILNYLATHSDNYLLALVILYIYEKFFRRVFNGTIKNLTRSIEINTNTIAQLKQSIDELKNFLYYHKQQ